MLRPSELLVPQLLDEVFCELVERDCEVKSSEVSLLSSVPPDFPFDLTRVPAEKK